MEEKKMVLTSRKALEIMRQVCPKLNAYTANIFLLRMPDWESDKPAPSRPCFMTPVDREDVIANHQKDIKGAAKIVFLMVDIEHPERGAFFLDLCDLLRSWNVFINITIHPGEDFFLSDGRKCRYNMASRVSKNRFLKQLGITGIPQCDDFYITFDPELDEPELEEPEDEEPEDDDKF